MMTLLFSTGLFVTSYFAYKVGFSHAQKKAVENIEHHRVVHTPHGCFKAISVNQWNRCWAVIEYGKTK